MMLVRPALHGACFAALALLLFPGTSAWHWLLEAAALLGLALLQKDVLRPWSDAVAWGGTLAWLALLHTGAPSLKSVVALGGAFVLLVWTLHRSTGGRRLAPLRSLAVWLASAAATCSLAWWPVLAARSEPIAVQDPQSAAGAALRILALAFSISLIALAKGAWTSWRSRRARPA